MKKYDGIDYQFRPESYWTDSTVLQAILRGVKGTRRRQLIRQALAEGALERVPDELQSEEVSEGIRDQLGRIHPSFMGGEYLPSCRSEETEIVRIDLRSTTADVISVRARWEDGYIHYSVVDEYKTEFGVHPETTVRPFSLAGLIRFIDRISRRDLWGPFATAYNELNAVGGSDRRSLRNFTTISSDIYPELYDHYEHVFDAWVKEGDVEEEQEDDDEY